MALGAVSITILDGGGSNIVVPPAGIQVVIGCSSLGVANQIIATRSITTLINTSGYDPYLSSLSVKKSKLAELTPCLKVLVPLVQQSTVDYVKNPTAANTAMVDMVTKLNSFWTLSTDFLAFSDDQIKKYDIMSNGPDKTLGNFDTPRVQKIIDDFWSTFGKNVATADTTITPASITDNEFIDTSIGL